MLVAILSLFPQAGSKSLYKAIMSSVAYLNDQLWKPLYSVSEAKSTLPVFALRANAVMKQVFKLLSRRLRDEEYAPIVYQGHHCYVPTAYPLQLTCVVVEHACVHLG
jgi:hypothetical protein